MTNPISICEWLENKSQAIVNKINDLIDISDQFHLTGQENKSLLVDSQIDSLYHEMNIIDDRLFRMLKNQYQRMS